MVRFNDVLGVMITASILSMSSGGNLPITCLQGNWKGVPQQSLLTLLAQYCYLKIDCIVLWFIFSCLFHLGEKMILDPVVAKSE